MSNRLGFARGQSYMGTNADQPPNWSFNNRPPTQYDTQNVSVGDLWLDNSALGILKVWILVSLAGDMTSKGSLAEWVQFAGSSVAVETLTGNSGGAVSPLANNINVIGDTTTINVVGNPGTHTLTISTSGAVADSFITNPATGTATPVAGVLTFAGTGGTTVSASGSTVTINSTSAPTIVETLTGNSGGAVGPTGNNINVVGTGVISVVGNPGTSTLTVTPSGSIASSFITSPATGTATPAAGVLTFTDGNNITFTASGSSVAAAVTGTTDHTVQLGNATGSLTSLANGTTGEVLTAQTGADPIWSSFSALSWTPTLSFGGASTGITYAAQEGIYQSLGNIVFYAGGLVLTSKGSATGIARIGGLPFACSGVFTVQFGQFATTFVTFPAGYTYAWQLNEIGTTNLIPQAGGSGVVQVNLDHTAFANNSQISVTGYYFRA